MARLERYNANKTYMSPASIEMTPELVKSEYPATTKFTHVVQTDSTGSVMYAMDALVKLRDMYKIDPNMTEDEAILAIETIINTPEPEPTPSAEERIAAAMEYQNLMSL